MTNSIIKVEGIGKKYRVRHLRSERYVALRDVLAEKVGNVFRLNRSPIEAPPSVEDFWALKDVSFEVKRGEVVGIIGRNGAGKSTLLKILSRITEPTEGRVEIDGRVGSLLEVGTGFHPELTGLENIYLNGAIMGMSRGEIKRRLDEIVAFAEIEKFLDTPVKRYSSGMYVKLAFAVAAHLEPEILLVDEVLAVGDFEFQKKCIGKMKSAAKAENRTVLFVSHNMGAIQALCNEIVLLRSGCFAGKGSVDAQIEAYLGDRPNFNCANGEIRRQLSSSLTVEFLQFTPNPVQSGSALSFVLHISSREPTRVREIAVLLYSVLGTRTAILDLRDTRLDYRVEPSKPLKLCGLIHALPLVEGDYSVGLFVNCGDFCGNSHDLTAISVIQPQRGELTPYSPGDRGLLELSYEFSVD